MPGICGIIDLFGRIDKANKIQKMVDSLTYDPGYKTYTFSNNKIALGTANLGVVNPFTQPLFNSDHSKALIMHGEIYDFQKENILQKEKTNDGENILTLFEKEGTKFIPCLNGSFVFAIYDFKKDILFIANDRYGLRPLYFYQTDQLFIFSSEMKALLNFPEIKKEIDENSLAEFFSFGFLLKDKTFFKSIKVFPQASVMTLQNGKSKTEKYWEPNLEEKDSFYSKEEDLEKAKFLLCQAVERQIKDEKRVGLFLSGGLDSRTILACANEKGYSLPAFTFGQNGCEDQKIAKDVALALDCLNYFYELTPDYLKNWAEKGVWVTEGMNNCVNFHGMEILPDVKKMADILLYGIEGNIWFGFFSLALLPFLWIKNQNKFVQRFYHQLNSPFSEDDLANLFQKELFQKVKGGPFLSLKESLDQIPAQSSFNKAYHFFVTEKDRRLSLLGVILDHFLLDYRLPFFDYDFVDFIQTIPPKQRTLCRFYRKLVSEKFPKMASIPYQRTGLPIHASTFSVLVKRLGENLSNRLQQKMRKRSLPRRRALADTDSWFRYELADFIRDILLNTDARYKQYLNRPCVENIIEKHLSGKQNLSTQIGALLTFELWLKLFVS
jgi:asparagine synthase (glutamine-hydrolysing)